MPSELIELDSDRNGNDIAMEMNVGNTLFITISSQTNSASASAQYTLTADPISIGKAKAIAQALLDWVEHCEQ